MAITLRLTEQQQEQVDNLKRFLGMKSSSKALLQAAGEYRKLKDDLARANSKVDDLEYKLQELKYSVENYNEAKERMTRLAEY